MYSNKLIRHINAFSRKEMTRFKEFCFSPYFNKHDQVRQLVEYLSDIFPKLDEKKCDRRLLYRKIFGSGPFDQAKLALVFTYTQRCLESFIAQEQYEENDFEKQAFLLKGLVSKNQYTTFEKFLKKSEQDLHQSKRQNADYFFQAYRMAKQADDYYNTLDKIRMDHSLAEKQSFLDRFFILEKLKVACEAKVRQRILKVAYQTRFLDDILQEIKEDEATFCQDPAILGYYKVYQMLDQSEVVACYHDARAYMPQFASKLNQVELIGIYIYFMNYCIAKINQGDSNFLKELFLIYKDQLEQGLLLEDGELSEWDYKNIVTTAIRLGELDWVIHFIESYKSKLSEEARENAYRFNLASYYYASGQLDKVLNLLIQVEYSDLRYNLGAKALLMRTYYDLKEYEALNSLTESFRQYLLRNKLMTDNRRKGLYNLFKLSRKAANLRSKMQYLGKDKSKKEVEKLRNEVVQTQWLYNRDWLMEKVDDLEN